MLKHVFIGRNLEYGLIRFKFSRPRFYVEILFLINFCRETLEIANLSSSNEGIIEALAIKIIRPDSFAILFALAIALGQCFKFHRNVSSKLQFIGYMEAHQIIRNRLI